MSYFLENSNFRPLILDDPFSALSTLLNSPPKLIIINANLQDMNGYQLCAFCRKSSQLKEIPVLLLDERENFIGRIRAKLSQASGYMGESVVPQELLEKVNKLLCQ